MLNNYSVFYCFNQFHCSSVVVRLQAELGLIVVAAYLRGTPTDFYKLQLTLLGFFEDALLVEVGCSSHLPHCWVASSSASGAFIYNLLLSALVDTHICSPCVVCRFTHACVCFNK